MCALLVNVVQSMCVVYFILLESWPEWEETGEKYKAPAKKENFWSYG